jgi:hypothetical protein
MRLGSDASSLVSHPATAPSGDAFFFFPRSLCLDSDARITGCR